MLSATGLNQAVTYHLPFDSEAKVSLTWPLMGADGPFALVRIDSPDVDSAVLDAGFLTERAVATIKQCLANMLNSVLEAVYVDGKLQSFANVWVVNQDESHQDFSLIWNYTSAESTLELKDLPRDILTTEFPVLPLPGKLPFSQRQKDHICAKQKHEDTSALLYCLETIQGLLRRSPNSIRVGVSEETAIGLLSIHGASAARALEGIDRHPD